VDTISSDGNLRQVLVCQNRTCRKSNSRKVLEAFLAAPVANVEVKGVGCLGQCGNGPMVLILPDEVWYWRVQPQDVPLLSEQHLRRNSVVFALLYPRFHS
jgi:(2Fe-2S) ferredoxin